MPDPNDPAASAGEALGTVLKAGDGMEKKDKESIQPYDFRHREVLLLEASSPRRVKLRLADLPKAQ